jgi:hypothetical protein
MSGTLCLCLSLRRGSGAGAVDAEEHPLELVVGGLGRASWRTLKANGPVTAGPSTPSCRAQRSSASASVSLPSRTLSAMSKALTSERPEK